MLFLDRNGRVALTNPAAGDRFGEWVRGQSYVSVLRQPSLLGPVEDAFHDRIPGRARFVHADGATETAFDVAILPLSPSDPNERGPVLLTFRDLSDREASLAMRRDFVANVSHELKTPLTALTGFVETLQGPARNDGPARDRFLGMMAQELSRMNRLVADLLSLGRVEAQSRRRPRDPVDLTTLLGKAIELLHPTAQDAGVTLTADLAPEAVVPGDADQLIQVAVNLIENGIKYGARPGTVEIGLHRVDRDPALRTPCWCLTVTDDGPGIAPEHLPRLTERFYRVDGARNRSGGGTGLGLAIVKHIVNRHRGRLRIDSNPGQGTCVTVHLPDG
ncbi:sensor histidine kinase [Jannaschia sp. LMIT008]|uniref:sensor histidine kinase n=1 Tax=Jannaschia maritima TaxID=3032585 RepID=UPI00281272D2|nr:ATP-binding protein [Jannaschia sp. LMIT008]